MRSGGCNLHLINPNPNLAPGAPDRRRTASRRRAFDEDALEEAVPKGRKSSVAPFPAEMPDFKEELKKSKLKVKTFMALLKQVSRPGTGNLVLRFVHTDPEVGDDSESDTEDKPESAEALVRQNPPGFVF